VGQRTLKTNIEILFLLGSPTAIHIVNKHFSYNKVLNSISKKCMKIPKGKSIAGNLRYQRGNQ
jgi:hypothetical protein